MISEKKIIQVGKEVAEDMDFQNKMCKFQGPRKGIYRSDQTKNHAEFPRVLDIGLGFCKGCNTSFGISRGEASFCLEFLGVM